MKNIINKYKFLILILVLFLLIRLTFFSENHFPEMVDDIRAHTVPMFDSMNRKSEKEYNFEQHILLLIQNKKLVEANKIVDSEILLKPEYSEFRLYKGMIYSEEGKYKEALQQYDTVVFIEKHEYPLIQGKKAEVFIKLHDYESAISNYKKAAMINFDYYIDVAQTFEAINKRDSALRYYLMYKENDTTNDLVNKKVISLKQGHTM